MKINNLTADQIRKSILQLAIQGKLVKQDPNDEPASELVKKIYKEKKKLIAEGKIKKEKQESFIFKGDDNCYYEKIGKETRNITDELPFYIPDSWMWIRLRSLCKIIYSGKSPKYSSIKNCNIMIGQASNNGIGIDLNLAKYCTDEFVKNMPEYYYLRKYDVLLNTLGHGTLGRCGIYNLDRNDILTDGHLFVFRFLNKITAIIIHKYLYLNRTNIEKSANGTTNQIFLSLSKVGDYLFPLAPLNEQQRIVDKINSFENLFKMYDSIENELTTLESKFPEKLKKSILQYAIEGKLVKQDFTNEPASVLLEHIKVEKEKLIKEGKIKRDKNESYIYQGDDKNYYENLPSGWCVCQLSNLINLVSGVDLESSKFSETNIGIPYLTGASNIVNDALIINRYTTENYVNSYLNDTLLSCKGTIGKIAINKIGNVHVARQFMAIKSFIHNDFLILYLKTIVNGLQNNARSMIPGIYRNEILSKIVLLPPLREQKRIENIINLFFNMIGNF